MVYTITALCITLCTRRLRIVDRGLLQRAIALETQGLNPANANQRLATARRDSNPPSARELIRVHAYAANSLTSDSPPTPAPVDSPQPPSQVESSVNEDIVNLLARLSRAL